MSQNKSLLHCLGYLRMVTNVWLDVKKLHTHIARDGGTVFTHGRLNNLSSHRSRDEYIIIVKVMPDL